MERTREQVQKFIDKYLHSKTEISVVEIGSRYVGKKTSDLFIKLGFSYIGVDIVPGNNVDIVISDSSRLPFESNKFDLCVSTNTFEHDSHFWLTFDEMARIVKPKGLIYINAPSTGPVHRHPMDCWRFLPDCWGALKSSCKTPVKILESFIDEGAKVWKFNICVFEVQ
jgi:SAM-dependent methyltransferase